MASCDKQVKCWDLASNQALQVAEHQAPVKACRWVKAPNYSALMTCSWDKTIKFWDTRAPNPMLSIDLPERAYCADVDYPVAVVTPRDAKNNLNSTDAKLDPQILTTNLLSFNIQSSG